MGCGGVGDGGGLRVVLACLGGHPGFWHCVDGKAYLYNYACMKKAFEVIFYDQYLILTRRNVLFVYM